MLTVSHGRHDAVGVVHVSGEVDANTAHILREGLSAAITEGTTHLVADLSGVTFMDSTGLGVLVGRLKVLRLTGGTMHCVVAEERVRRVFLATGLDAVLPLHDDVESALAAVTAGAAES